MSAPDTDVVIVGAGPAGALAAVGLARKGVKVTMLDSGPRVDRPQAVQRFRQAIAKVPESPYPSLPYAPRPTVLDLKDYYVQQGPELFQSTYERRVGGTTWHWLGTALRLLPNDFRLRSRYGVGVDWPISYDDLEPWYARAEEELGVAGADVPQLGAPRSGPYPMPAIPQSYLDHHFARAGRRLGLPVTPTPQARNSVPRDGRPACCGNASCIPICPIGAKYDATVHVARAEKLGVRVLDSSVARQVEVGGSRTTVTYLRPDGSEHTLTGRTLVLAANAIETPKLMLLSQLGGDLVGRFLMDHPIQLSWALSDQPVFPYRGPLATSGIETLRDGSFRKRRAAFRIEIGNDGWSWPVGGPTVQANATKRVTLGREGLAGLGDSLARQVRLASLTEPLPDPQNRVTLATEKDDIGIPRPQLSYSTGDYSRAGLAVAQRHHDRLFSALGTTEVKHFDGPQGAGHVMGRCRMGRDTGSSVVDPDLRLHDHPNCFVLGASVFPSVGTANPTLTLAALSLRAVAPIAASLS